METKLIAAAGNEIVNTLVVEKMWTIQPTSLRCCALARARVQLSVPAKTILVEVSSTWNKLNRSQKSMYEEKTDSKQKTSNVRKYATGFASFTGIVAGSEWIWFIRLKWLLVACGCSLGKRKPLYGWWNGITFGRCNGRLVCPMSSFYFPFGGVRTTKWLL